MSIEIEIPYSVKKFPKKMFWKFCSHLKIDSKEMGTIRLGKDDVLGSQTYFIDEIARGVDEGCHYFVILKGRQLGITTICIALDLFWNF